MLRWLGCAWCLVLVSVCAVHAHRQETMGQASPVTVVTPGVKAPVTPTPSWPVYRRSAPTLAPRQNAGTSAPASGSSSGSSSSSDNDDRLPAGGLTVTQPAQTADESYYKIAPHETVTFGWSFTSLKTQPDRLYVVASCSQNGYTYPIAPSPQGIPGDATSVTWYPYGYRLSAQANGQPDLAAAKYRLVIYDEEGPSAAARGGRFSPNNAVEFAMYFPQAYTPLAEWNCASCNGAQTLSLRSPLVIGIGSTLLVGALSTLWLLP